MKSNNLLFSKTPSINVESSGSPFFAISFPSTVRQGTNLSKSDVKLPIRAVSPSLITSNEFVLNSAGI